MSNLKDFRDKTPVGNIEYYPVNAIPNGRLKANGAAISRTTYSKLFSIIGTMYGAGNGSTTFNLPDLRGEFIRGFDDGRGADAGRGIGSYQSDAFQGHWHQFTYSSTEIIGGAGGGQLQNGGSVNNSKVRSPISDGSNGNPRTANETRPRNRAMLATIKYR